MSEIPRVAAVLGVGPGLGLAVAHRFAREGFRVALMAREQDRLHSFRNQIADKGGSALCIEADATDPESVASAFNHLRREIGIPDVLVYNVGAFHIAGIMEIAPEQFQRCWQLNCFGAFLAMQQVLPGMVERGCGTILLTSATGALRGGKNFACLAVGKFGLRALAQSTAREYGPLGVHVAHIVIDGLIDTPRIRSLFPGQEVMLDPNHIADSYWHLFTQKPSAWSLELDIRPARESF